MLEGSLFPISCPINVNLDFSSRQPEAPETKHKKNRKNPDV